ncbi:uncharacterized protein [Phyllobates terribilis]|uniref:uncharacterized protein n=1 Tax=Phyllobates terribilis TaxID=111132 RepID=UPI003CCAD084
MVEMEALEFSELHVLTAIALGLLIIRHCRKYSSTAIYLVDFSCCRPPDYLRVYTSNFSEHIQLRPDLDQPTIDFQIKMQERSGISDEAYLPSGLHEMPPNTALSETREEVEHVLFAVVEDLFSKLPSDITVNDIDILVTNCSLHSPTPSLSSLIVRRFGLRNDVCSVHLAGMGCSAGILAISLASDLLRARRRSASLALVLSMEAVTPNVYSGKRKSMVLPNALFRMGGAGILLSNRRSDSGRAKYRLNRVVRTHIGASDQAYASVYQDVDEEGFGGVALSRDIVKVAGDALKKNLIDLAPSVLPYSEMLRFAISTTIAMLRPGNKRLTHVPDFKKAFDHVCIHAGGRAVIDAVEESLRLKKEDIEASKMTLYRFGNTSSSSVWYELSYLEAKGRIKRGDKVWQVGFGSGFKCNSLVWECVSEIDPTARNAWSDRIHLYPVSTN